jgi:hypothetical protein
LLVVILTTTADLDDLVVDFPTCVSCRLYSRPSPSDLEELEESTPVPGYDATIKWLASYHHPQQRRNLLHRHQAELEKFYNDSNLQWDDETYVVDRFDPNEPIESLFPSRGMRKNALAATSGDGGNISLNKDGTAETKLSINELQLYLSNQAASLRMEMNSEYEDLRAFQNEEMEIQINLKARSELEFRKTVEETQKRPHHPIRQASLAFTPNPPPHPIQPAPPIAKLAPPIPTAPHPSFALDVSPTTIISQSPATYSPLEIPDINTVANDSSLIPFVKFMVQLKVVRENWAKIAGEFNHYVSSLSRGLMLESAFAKGILQDAVRSNPPTKYPIDQESIQKLRDGIKAIRETMTFSRIISQVLLEMAEAGDVTLSTTANEDKGEKLGLKILSDVVSLERRVKGESSQASSKATDPRQR